MSQCYSLNGDASRESVHFKLLDVLLILTWTVLSSLKLSSLAHAEMLLKCTPDVFVRTSLQLSWFHVKRKIIHVSHMIMLWNGENSMCGEVSVLSWYAICILLHSLFMNFSELQLLVSLKSLMSMMILITIGHTSLRRKVCCQAERYWLFVLSWLHFPVTMAHGNSYCTAVTLMPPQYSLYVNWDQKLNSIFRVQLEIIKNYFSQKSGVLKSDGEKFLRIGNCQFRAISLLSYIVNLKVRISSGISYKGNIIL